jgi:hypothetical protein
MKTVLVLLAEISGLLIIFALFLFVLNYFKIITLPNLFPNQQVNSTTAQTQPLRRSTTQPISAWTKTVTDQTFSNYVNYAESHNFQTATATTGGLLLTEGFYTGFQAQTIRIATARREMDFLLSKDSTIDRIASDGAVVTYAWDSYLGIPFGTYFKLLYKNSPTTLDTVNIQFSPYYKL